MKLVLFQASPIMQTSILCMVSTFRVSNDNGSPM
jgi:hypothetical protein